MYWCFLQEWYYRFVMLERPSQNYNTKATLATIKDPIPVTLQRSGGLKPPPRWDFQEIENRGGMLLPMLLVPAIRYTQDTPQDKNELLARDISAVGSATMLYFFLQRVFSRGANALTKPEVIKQLPQALHGVAKHLAADCDKHPYKNKFLAYVPAQAISLVVSAFVGPAIGGMAIKHTRAIKHWLQSPDKMQHIVTAWQNQPKEDKTTHALQGGVGVASFALAAPLAYKSVSHWDIAKKYGGNLPLRIVDHDFPVLGSSLLAALGVSTLVSLARPSSKPLPPSPSTVVAPNASPPVATPPKDEDSSSPWFIKLRHPSDATTGTTTKHDKPLIKAPIIGAALLGTTYSLASIGAIGYTLLHQNKPEKLQKLFNYETGYHAMHWILPSLILPSIRYTQDPKDKRDEFYIRDFTHFWLGSLVYWGTKKTAKPLLRSLNAIEKPSGISNPVEVDEIQENALKLSAATLATLAQIANNGVVAPRLSHLFVSRFTQHNQQVQQNAHTTRAEESPPLTKHDKTGTIKPTSHPKDDDVAFTHPPIYANYTPHTPYLP